MQAINSSSFNTIMNNTNSSKTIRSLTASQYRSSSKPDSSDDYTPPACEAIFSGRDANQLGSMRLNAHSTYLIRDNSGDCNGVNDMIFTAGQCGAKEASSYDTASTDKKLTLFMKHLDSVGLGGYFLVRSSGPSQPILESCLKKGFDSSVKLKNHAYSFLNTPLSSCSGLMLTPPIQIMNCLWVHKKLIQHSIMLMTHLEIVLLLPQLYLPPSKSVTQNAPL